MATAAATASAPVPAPADALNPYRWIILLGLVTAAVMEVLDTTIVNVALPQMMGNLGATPDEIGWVSTGYILSNVVVLPMTAWLSIKFGRRNYLVASIILFIISSFFCGMSHTLGELVFWRVVQGAGGAALLSTAQATMVEIFPRNNQGMVQAIFGLGMVCAPTIAPALGGYITDNYTWPWVFFINIPIGIISATIVWSFLQDSKYTRDTGKVDYFGIATLAIGLVSLQYVLEEGERWDWFNDVTIKRLAIVAAITLVAFIAWELSPKNKAPIVDLHVLKNKTLRGGIILSLALGFGLYGGLFIYPMFVQRILHFTAIETGLALLPGGVATGITMISCGRLLNKKPPADPRKLLIMGVTLFIVSMIVLSQMTSQSGQFDTQVGLVIRGLGLGFMFIPITVASFSGLQGRDIAQASALLNLARQLGGSFGIAVLNTYIVSMEAFHRSMLVQNVASANQMYTDRLHTFTHMFADKGFSIPAAIMAGQSMIDNAVTAQAATLAYDDAFLLLGVAMLCAAPSVMILRRSVGGPPAGAGGGH